MKKSSLTKHIKESSINSNDVVLSFKRLFVVAKAMIRNLNRGLLRRSEDVANRSSFFRKICHFCNFKKETIMVTKNRGRFATALVLGTIAVLSLTSCGGGGSSTPPPVVKTCANGAGDFPTCTAAPQFTRVEVTPLDGSEVPSNVSLQMNVDVTGTMVGGTSTIDFTCLKLDGGTAIIAGTPIIGAKTWTFTPSSLLPEGARCTAILGAIYTNAGGMKTSLPSSARTSFTIKVTPSTIPSYADKVVILWTASYPYMLTKSGAVRVVNKTHYAGLAPFYNCWLAEKPLTSGKVLTSCQYSVDFTRAVYYINPTNGAMYDYAGAVPVDNVWHDVQPFDPMFPTWGAKAKIAAGWYFTTTDTRWVIKFQTDGTNAVSTIQSGTLAENGDVPLMRTYSYIAP